VGPRRILVLVDDARAGADLVFLLEDGGHRVEHVRHVEDAMVRTRVASYDLFFVAASHCDSPLARGWAAKHPRIPMILVDPSSEAREAAYYDGVTCLASPLDPAHLSAALRGGGRVVPTAAPSSGMRRRVRRLLVVLRKSWATSVDHDLICNELNAWCFISPDVRGAMRRLDKRVDAVVMDAELMVDPAAGVALRTRIHGRGLPVIALRIDPGADEAGFIEALRRTNAELGTALASRAFG
jgi:hypothetical protein